MDIISIFFSFFTDIGLLVATLLGTIVVAIRGIIGRFGFTILAGLGKGAGAGIGSKLTGGRSGYQFESKNMPTGQLVLRGRQALWTSASREKRMNTYIAAWYNLLALRGGPFAISIYLQSLHHKGFQQKIQRLQKRCREFDRLEDNAQRALQHYERDYEKQCEPLRDQLLDHIYELSKWKARHKRWAFKFWHKRWRHNKKNMFSLRRKISMKRYTLLMKEYRLNMIYRARLEPLLKTVHQFEHQYLTHWVHSFEADLKSFELTVISGRLVEIISNMTNRRFLENLGLGELPREPAYLRSYMQKYLDNHNIGYGPEATIENLFENYLRVKLISEPGMAERWGISKIWLKNYLPPPGALGIVQSKYHHMAPNQAWNPQGESETIRFSPEFEA